MPINSDYSKAITDIYNNINRLDNKINLSLYREERLKIKSLEDHKNICNCPLYETAETGECTFWAFGKCSHSHR